MPNMQYYSAPQQPVYPPMYQPVIQPNPTMAHTQLTHHQQAFVAQHHQHTSPGLSSPPVQMNLSMSPSQMHTPGICCFPPNAPFQPPTYNVAVGNTPTTILPEARSYDQYLRGVFAAHPEMFTSYLMQSHFPSNDVKLSIYNELVRSHYPNIFQSTTFNRDGHVPVHHLPYNKNSQSESSSPYTERNSGVDNGHRGRGGSRRGRSYYNADRRTGAQSSNYYNSQPPRDGFSYSRRGSHQSNHSPMSPPGPEASIETTSNESRSISTSSSQQDLRTPEKQEVEGRFTQREANKDEGGNAKEVFGTFQRNDVEDPDLYKNVALASELHSACKY